MPVRNPAGIDLKVHIGIRMAMHSSCLRLIRESRTFAKKFRNCFRKDNAYEVR
jgi:hypothetical protein